MQLCMLANSKSLFSTTLFFPHLIYNLTTQVYDFMCNQKKKKKVYDFMTALFILKIAHYFLQLITKTDSFSERFKESSCIVQLFAINNQYRFIISSTKFR